MAGKMGSPRRLLSGLVAVMVVSVVVLGSASVTEARKAKAYVVGYPIGWGYGVDFSAWARGKTFYAGDKLVFKYEAGYHNVWAFKTFDKYKRCDFVGGKQLAAIDDGTGRRHLTYTWVVPKSRTKKVYRFGCQFYGHCLLGFKFQIIVPPSR